MAIAPAGTLYHGCVSQVFLRGQLFLGNVVSTYLRRKTHLHVVLSTMTPPNNGPMTVASAISADTMLPYLGYLGFGMSSKKTIMDTEKHPAAPMPCMLRSTILHDGLVRRVRCRNSDSQLGHVLRTSTSSRSSRKYGQGGNKRPFARQDVAQLGPYDDET